MWPKPERISPWDSTSTTSRPSELPAETRTFARLCASLTEEAEAIGWYEQRMAVEPDHEARAIMRDAQGEEFKHFCMNLEFLMRRTPLWREIAAGILFQEGDIVEHGEEAEEEASRRRPLGARHCRLRVARHRRLRGAKREPPPSRAGADHRGWLAPARRRGSRAAHARTRRPQAGGFSGPHGWEHSATNLGRTEALAARPATASTRAQRRVLPLVELRARFSVARSELDDADRGAEDVDLDALDQAARQIACAENAAVFHGWGAAGITGIDEASTHDSDRARR